MTRRSGPRASVAGMVGWGWCVAALGGIGALQAEQRYDLKEITPAIQQAIGHRQARYDELKRLKSAGVVGEGNQGLAEALTGDDPVRRLLEAENADRTIIYQAVVEQNQLGADGLARVQAVFAEVQREKAQPGEMIQDPAGPWVKK